MPVIFIERSNLRRCVALLVLGIALGFAGATLIASSEIDGLISANERQRAQISDLKGHLESLEKSLRSQSRLAVKQLSVETNLKNEHLHLKMEKYVKNLLDELVGKELADIDPMMVYKIVDSRTVTLENQDFILHVKALLIGESSLLILDISSGRIKIED